MASGALAGLAQDPSGHRLPTTFDAARPKLARALGTVVALLVLASVAVPMLGRGSYAVLGNTWDAHRLATTGGDGRFLVTTVLVRQPTAMAVVVSLFRDDVSLVPRDVVDHGSFRRGGGSGGSRFEGSRRSAWAAARRCLGLGVDPVPPAAPRPRLDGASGGLMMALAYVEALSGRPLTGDRVAGTE